MVIRNVREDHGRALLEMLEHLRKGSRTSSEVTVRVLAAADHDGVCAAKILERMLDVSDVKHVVCPVMENADITEQFQLLAEQTEVLSMVLLNCGGSTDLERLAVESKAREDFRCFVVDAHRPLGLSNLSKRNTRIVVLDDDPIAEARGLRPPVDDVDSDTSGDESDPGGEDQENDGGRANQDLEPGRKRGRRSDKEEKIRRKRQRVQEYFLTSYHAMPAAMSMFQMARQTVPPSQDFLWLAAVGLLGYMDLGLMSEHMYNRLAWEELKEALDNSNEVCQSSGSLRPSATLPDSERSDDEDLAFRPRAPASVHRLRFESDLRLTLYKHWSLEESAMHSPYFYGTLELHRDIGLRSLKNFFATAGLEPSAYQQLFRHMEPPTRKSLRRKFTQHGKAYGLTETRMFLDQFVQVLGVVQREGLIQPDISSLDIVHVLLGLICNLGDLAEAPAQSDGQRDPAVISRLAKQAMWKNFYQASDAVLCDNPTLLREGIHQAVELSKAVQSLARQIRDTKAIKATKRFRWCKIDQPPRLFRHPLAARKLAMWLSQTIYAYSPRHAAERPLLVMIRDAYQDCYLCVGVTPPSVSDVDEFGNLFRDLIRESPSLRYRYDFFDKSCIAVAADDIGSFVNMLIKRT
mmetsp:Transcript_52818/g.98941  ORF Transcript_52818/g.98941 Transcript_52818/m.98941 type:complete len:634 (-) Transcript_52818:117-2018(-)